MASIQRCSVDSDRPFDDSGHSIVWRIDCKIQYVVGDHGVQSRIRSRSTHSDKTTAQMQQWVAEHGPGSAMEIHYDPSDPKTAVLTETDMPFAGPRTPNNVKLLAIAAVAFVVFYSLARILGRRNVSR